MHSIHGWRKSDILWVGGGVQWAGTWTCDFDLRGEPQEVNISFPTKWILLYILQAEVFECISKKSVLFNCNLIFQQIGHVLITKIPQRGTSIFYENIKQTKKH